MTAKSGFSLIPIGAKVAAALVFLAIVAGLYCVSLTETPWALRRSDW